MSERPFFVGYLPAPRPLRALLAVVALAVVAAFAGVALALALSAPDPGGGGLYGWEDGIEGAIVADAYPLLHVTRASERFAAGQVIVLSALNKTGAAAAKALAGEAVTVSGLYTRRGDVVLLQLRWGERGARPRKGPAPAPPPREALGRWRLTGEICDGKCYAGAMRPGAGIAHKACAALCVAGEVPAILVLAEPFEGEEFLLVTTADGRPAGPQIMDLAGMWLSVEGEVERLGDLLIFRLDPATARTR